MDENLLKGYAFEWVFLQGENLYTFMYLFAIIIPAIIFTTEFNDNTMKNILFRGTSKVYVFIAKVIFCWFILLILNILIVLFGSMVVYLRYGFESVFSMEAIKNMIDITGKITVIMITYSSINCLISILTQKMILSITLSYGIRLCEVILVIFARSSKSTIWIEKFIIGSFDFYLQPSISKNTIEELLYCIGITFVVSLVAVFIFCRQDVK